MHLLLERAGIAYQKNIPLAPYTTFHIGGIADYLVFPKTVEEAVSVYRLCQTQNIPCHVLGRGANLLVRDRGVRGIVLSTKHLQKIKIFDSYIKAEAGVPLGKLLALCKREGLSGIEPLCGIPATVGGAAAMNAGAYGVEIGQAINEITFFDGVENTLKSLTPAQFSFGYRHSLCHEREGLILAVTFRFSHGDPLEIERNMREIAQNRKQKQPLDHPNAGSIFKRPFPLYAPKLIEEAGLKGKRIGNAQISNKHAGFILNLGNATAKDVEDLMAYTQKTVRDKFSVELQPEIILWGE